MTIAFNTPVVNYKFTDIPAPLKKNDIISVLAPRDPGVSGSENETRYFEVKGVNPKGEIMGTPIINVLESCSNFYNTAKGFDIIA